MRAPGAAIPISGVAFVPLDPMQMRMNPGRVFAGIRLRRLMRALPISLGLPSQAEQGGTQPLGRLLGSQAVIKTLEIHRRFSLDPDLTGPTPRRSRVTRNNHLLTHFPQGLKSVSLTSYVAATGVQRWPGRILEIPLRISPLCL